MKIIDFIKKRKGSLSFSILVLLVVGVTITLQQATRPQPHVTDNQAAGGIVPTTGAYIGAFAYYPGTSYQDFYNAAVHFEGVVGRAFISTTTPTRITKNTSRGGC